MSKSIFLYYVLLTLIKAKFIPVKISSFEKYEININEGYILFLFNNKFEDGDIIIQFEKENEFKNSSIYFYKDISSIILNEKKEFENALYSYYSYKKYELVINKYNPSFLGKNDYYIILNQFIKGKILIYNSLDKIPLDKKNNNFFKFSHKYSNNNLFTFEIIKFIKPIYLHYQFYNDFYNSTSLLEIYDSNLKKLIYNSTEWKQNQSFYKLPFNTSLEIKYKLNIQNNTLNYLILDFYDDNFFYLDKEQDKLEFTLIETQEIFYIIDITNIEINEFLVIHLKWDCSFCIEFTALGKTYNTLNKDYIKENIPKNSSEYDAKIISNKGFKYQFISLKKINDDEKYLLLKLTNINDKPQKFFIQRINSPITINETGLIKSFKNNETYIYYINRIRSFDRHKRPRIIYSSKENKFEIYSGNILMDKFDDFSFKGRFSLINPWTISKDISIIVGNEINQIEDFDFEVRSFNETLINFTLNDIDINTYKINNGHRFQINDCEKKNYSAVFRYNKKFISYSKLLFGDAEIFAFKLYDNKSIKDFFSFDKNNFITTKFPKENIGSFEFYMIKCTKPSIIDLHFISEDYSKNQIFENGKTLMIYLKEGKNVLFNSPFNIEPYQIELIENENKNQEIYLSLNGTNNETLNNNKLFYNYVKTLDYYYDLNITSKKSNNLIIFRNGIPNKNYLLTSEMVIKNSKENNIFIFPKNLINIKEAQIFIDKNSDLTVNIDYYTGIGKYPFYSRYDFLTNHIHNENERRKYLIIPNPYNNIKNLTDDENFYISIKVDLDVVYTYVFVKENINISKNILSLVEGGLIKINLNRTEEKKKILLQFNKCENEYIAYKFIQNGKGIYEDISYLKTSYKLIDNVEEHLIMEITGIKESLFKYIYLDNEYEYDFKPLNNYTIYCQIKGNNQLEITFSPFLNNEKVKYTIIISTNDKFKQLDNDCSLKRILNNENKNEYHFFFFDDQGQKNQISKTINFPYEKNGFYAINIIAQQQSNYEMIVSYNAINFYYDNGGTGTVLLVTLLLILILIIGVTLFFSIHYMIKKRRKQTFLFDEEIDQISF